MREAVLGLLMSIVVCPALASPAQDIHVSLADAPDGGHTLQGSFVVDASTAAVWSVLTDYNRMAEFVSTIKSSRLIEAPSDQIWLEQKMVGKAGWFHKKIFLRLNVKEEPPHKITFHDMAGTSFKSYAGTLDIAAQGGRTLVDYQLAAQPKFFAPDFLAIKAFQNTVKQLLTEVRAEIVFQTSVE